MPHQPVLDPADRGVRTFHGRSGRLGRAAHLALADLYPRYGVDLSTARASDLFDQDLPIVLELGSGMGEATVAMAQSEPDVGILAAEVHTAGVASLLRRVEAAKLPNVRVVHADGVQVLRQLVPPDALAGVRIWFPDPWPKARHHKRRFVRPDLVGLTASRLAPGGRLHAATDWADYAEQMLSVLSGDPRLANEYAGFAPRPAWRPETRFERKGLRQGHVVRDLMFRRI